MKEEDVPDYYDIIKNPMCLDMMFTTVDKKEYTSLERFMKDIILIQDNAKEYNPNTSSGRKIIRAAAAMVDEVESMVHRFKKKLGYNLFKKCEEILARREEAKKMEKAKSKPIASPQKQEEKMEKEKEKEKENEKMMVEPACVTESDQKQAAKLIEKMNTKWKDLTLNECIVKYEQIVRICMEQDSLYHSAQDKMKVGNNYCCLIL